MLVWGKMMTTKAHKYYFSGRTYCDLNCIQPNYDTIIVLHWVTRKIQYSYLSNLSLQRRDNNIRVRLSPKYIYIYSIHLRTTTFKSVAICYVIPVITLWYTSTIICIPKLLYDMDMIAAIWLPRYGYHRITMTLS